MESKHLAPEIRCISNLIKREAEKSELKKKIDNMTGVHGWVIGYLATAEQPVFQRDLEKRFSIRRSTCSNILSLMEKNELIIRKPSDQDRRLRELVLTEKALAIHAEVCADHDRFNEKLCHGLTQKEISDFLSTLNKLKANLNGGTK